MARSIAARPPVGPLDVLWRPFETAGSLVRGSFKAIACRRRLRISLLAGLASLGLLTGGWLLLRDSSFVRVEHVRVSGLRGPQAQAIETALNGAASRMSTLDMHPAALRAAVASFPVVRTIHATSSFPHGLRIEVTEQLPVAALTIGGVRTAVAADGVVLGPALLSGSLPALAGQQGAAAEIGREPGQRVEGASVLAELTVLGAAPKPLRRVTARVFSSPGGLGLTLAMRNGLLVYFGDSSRPHAKWLSLARVLADSSSAGATYIDVRVPERPAAGFSADGAPSAASGSTAEGTTATPESTVSALAAGLTDDTNGEPAAAAGTTSSGTEASPEPEATAESEAASGTAPEAEASSESVESAATGEPESPASGG
jgi:cell division protein FtsQ